MLFCEAAYLLYRGRPERGKHSVHDQGPQKKPSAGEPCRVEAEILKALQSCQEIFILIEDAALRTDRPELIVTHEFRDEILHCRGRYDDIVVERQNYVRWFSLPFFKYIAKTAVKSTRFQRIDRSTQERNTVRNRGDSLKYHLASFGSRRCAIIDNEYLYARIPSSEIPNQPQC